MKQLYELEMTVIFYLANGEMDMACKGAAQLVELTLDSALTANEQRFKLRSSPAVVNSISRIGEEPVFQEGFRVIAEVKAKEFRDLNDIQSISHIMNTYIMNFFIMNVFFSRFSHSRIFNFHIFFISLA
jgi:hypothetical protein